MPVWSYSELCACRTTCFPNVSEETLQQAFARWYVLVHASRDGIDLCITLEHIGAASAAMS